MMGLYGAFAASEDMRVDTHNIQKIIDEEFERIDPQDWKGSSIPTPFQILPMQTKACSTAFSNQRRYPSFRYRVGRISLWVEIVTSSR